METEDLGNIAAISRLIDQTAEDYIQFVQRNTDPLQPSKPRLRFIGGTLFRLDYEVLWRENLPQSYTAAKKLGYRGTLECWDEMIREQVAALVLQAQLTVMDFGGFPS